MLRIFNERSRKKTPTLDILVPFVRKFLLQVSYNEATVCDRVGHATTDGLPISCTFEKNDKQTLLLSMVVYFELMLLVNHIFAAIMTSTFMILHHNHNPVVCVVKAILTDVHVQQQFAACRS